MHLDSIVLDIVFFGESLPSEFYHNLDEDSEKVCLYDTFIYTESSHRWEMCCFCCFIDLMSECIICVLDF